MISAKDAKNKTLGAKKLLEEKQMKTIEILIGEAIKKGRYEIILEESLFDTTKKELKANGYQIKELAQTPKRVCISWSDEDASEPTPVVNVKEQSYDNMFAVFEEQAKKAGKI